MESEKFNISDIYPLIYSAKVAKASIIDVPALRIMAISGEGEPNGPRFRDSVEALYSIAYAINFMPKKGNTPEGFVSFRVSALEALWSMKNGKPYDASDGGNLIWEVFIVVPGFVTQGVVNMAVSMTLGIKPNPSYNDIHISSLQEKKSAQILHFGSYSTAIGDIKTLASYIKKRGYKAVLRHHEIYLSDPTRSKSGRVKTIIRQPIVRI